MTLNEYIIKNGDKEIAINIDVFEQCLNNLETKTIHDIQFEDKYFVLCNDGNISKIMWDNGRFDNKNRAMGSAFLTREEAERRKKVLQIEAEFIRLGGRREYKLGCENWHIFYYPPVDDIDVTKDLYLRGDIYFDTEEDANNVIKKIGKYRIFENYFKPRIIKG